MRTKNTLYEPKTYDDPTGTRAKLIKEIIAFLELFIPSILARRITSVLLLLAGVPHDRVAEWTGSCDRSIRQWMKQISSGDTDKLLTVSTGAGRKSKFVNIEEQVLADIESGNYHTLQQIADMVKEKYNIEVSLMAVSRLLKKNGIRKLKSSSLPAKADPAGQRNFYDETLKPLMEKVVQKGTEHVLLFMDASHFVMGNDFLGGIYGRTRRFVKTFSGRKRYNVLGAIDYVSKKVITVTNDTYITAVDICKMLVKATSEYTGKQIHIILDNARYQKCDLVRKLAEYLNIDLVFIPPYSPNLNLIERLWKFVKTRLRSKYYDDFSLFQSTINSIINETTTTYRNQIESLIGEKVQLFDDLIPLCENTFIHQDSEKPLAA